MATNNRRREREREREKEALPGKRSTNGRSIETEQFEDERC